MNSRDLMPALGSAAARRQAGFTLVELMISLVIGLFIVLALVTLLINVNRNNSELTKTNRVIENGRIALQLLQEDLSHTGFWGGHIPQFDDLAATVAPADVPTDVPDPCLPFTAPWTAAHRTNLVGISAQGYGIGSPVPSPSVPVCASAPTGVINSPKANTDVLVVNHAETCAAGVAGCAPLTQGALYVQPSRCSSDTTTFSLDQYDPATFHGSALALHNRDCGVASFVDVRKLVSNLYYVRDYAVTPGDGIPTLMRSEFGVTAGVPARQPAQALIEGVEGFRIEFGIDSVSDSGGPVTQTAAVVWANPGNKTSPTNRGDGIPDGSYVHCGSAGCSWQQLINAVAVKVYVLIRSENTTPGYIDSKAYNLGGATLGPFADGYKRHLFSLTIRLTNVASRRETP